MPMAAKTHRAYAPIPRVDNRGGSAKRGYDATWQRLRLMYLRDNPLCVECERQGEIVAATDVDHITPIASGGERLDESNLQSLCRSCHSRKTVTEDGGFGRNRRCH